MDHVRRLVEQAYGAARAIGSERVLEEFRGDVAWEGEVQVFMVDHPDADRCYAWKYDDDGGWVIATVLGVPPINSAKDAVRAYSVADQEQGPSE